MVLLVLSATLSHAGSIAVLDFDGVGVPGPQAALATDALRDALFVEAAQDAIAGSDIAARIDARDPSALESARAAFSAGRARLAAGDPAGAAERLEESVRQHDAALSHLVRRGEAADARWSLALAYLRAGRTDDAGRVLAQVAAVWPGYATTRAADKPPAAIAGLKRAEEQIRTAPRTPLPVEVLRDVEAGARADVVVTGTVLADGTVLLSAWDDGTLVGEASTTLSLPVSAADPQWAGLARDVAAAIAAPMTSTAARTDADDRTERDLESIAPPDRDADADRDTLREETERPPEAEEDLDSPREERPRTREPRARATRESDAPKRPRIRGADGPPNRTPIGERWWVWTGALVVVGGGVAATVVALQEPPPVVTTLPDAWTLTVAVPPP
jgi:hypothetical protein